MRDYYSQFDGKEQGGKCIDPNSDSICAFYVLIKIIYQCCAMCFVLHID